jgi:hypothetical protein
MNLRRSITLTWIALLLGGCSLRNQPKVAAVPPPKPAATVPRPPPQPETPLVELQTRVYLPQPQPIPEETLTVIRMPQRPAPPQQQAKPAPPKPAATPVVTTPTAPLPQAPPPETTQPPPPRQRLRPAETPAERRRIERDITSRRAQTLRLLNDISRRNLNDEQKAALARIQAFLEQADAAMKNNDLREADALSSRALLLSQDLHSGR